MWERNAPLGHAAFWASTVLDFAFIVIYVFLLRGLRKWLPAASAAGGFISALAAVADVVENLLRIVMVAGDTAWWLLVYLAWVATTAKWLSLAAVVLLLAIAWRGQGLSTGPGEFTRQRLSALWRLRVPMVLVGVWGLFLILDPTGQSADTFRRWLDDVGRFVISALWTFGAASLLGFATWTTAARRSVLAHFDVTAGRPHAVRWAIVIAVLAFLAWKPGWLNLLGAAITVAIVFVLEGFAHWRGLATDGATTRLEDLAKGPTGVWATAVKRVARGLALWPVIALLLALASAWTAPALVLLALGEDEVRAGVAGVLALVCVGGAAWVAGTTDALAAVDQGVPDRSDWRPQVLFVSFPWPDKLELRHVAAAAVCLVLCACALIWPLDLPSHVGVVGMTAIAIAMLSVAIGECQRYGETHAPPRGLAMLGFDAIPVTLLLATAFVVASVFNDGGYHAVARNDAATPPREGDGLDDAFGGWVARNCADRPGDGRMVPMVFVASQGGGIRAAYWTTSVLTDLLGAPAGSAGDEECPDAATFDRIFALSGASGGSLGITSYWGRAGTAATPDPWYREAWGETDLAAVPTTWGLLVDLPRNFIGFDAPDRARRFEEAWERQDPALARDFFAAQEAGPGPRSTPLLMLAGTQVETGCRFNVSLLRLTPRATTEQPGGCAALLKRGAVGTDAGSPSRQLPAAAMTSDVLDYLCDEGSVNRSTAALMSARFPYVSPSGQLTGCDSGRPTAVVDGGYAENTGGQAILDLWARLAPTVAAHNAGGQGALIVPIYVEIDNHYAKAGEAGTVGRTGAPRPPGHRRSPRRARRSRRPAARERRVLGRAPGAARPDLPRRQSSHPALRPHRADREPRHPGPARVDAVGHRNGRPRPSARGGVRRGPGLHPEECARRRCARLRRVGRTIGEPMPEASAGLGPAPDDELAPGPDGCVAAAAANGCGGQRAPQVSPGVVGGTITVGTPVGRPAPDEHLAPCPHHRSPVAAGEGRLRKRAPGVRVRVVSGSVREFARAVLPAPHQHLVPRPDCVMPVATGERGPSGHAPAVRLRVVGGAVGERGLDEVVPAPDEHLASRPDGRMPLAALERERSERSPAV